MSFLNKIEQIQNKLKENGLDGWLLYDFHGSNHLAHELLDLPLDRMLTRRFFYWIPQKGEPEKILHKIEARHLDFLPGDEMLYLSWKELERLLAKLLRKAKKIAMEYSPRNSNPYVSKVDAGTIELIKELGVEVVSSADLLQYFTSVLDEEQIRSHKEAARILSKTAQLTWDMIADQIRQNKPITEYDVQQFILSEFLAHDFVTDEGPICAVNENSALPHYLAHPDTAKILRRGDYVLIDLWCKKNAPKAIYADITRVGVIDSAPTPRQEEVYKIVDGALEAGLSLIQSSMAAKKPLTGAEVDDACRHYIEERGYGDFFPHRSGHNIGIQVHGAGAHLDNLETSDKRKLLPSTCFSLEPGIYLPNEFGVRIEYDVLIHGDGKVEVTGGRQEGIICLL